MHQSRKLTIGDKYYLAVCLFVILLAITIPLKGQAPQDVTQINLESAPVQQPQGISGTPVGSPGGTTIYYWVVANYVAGQGPAGGPIPVSRTVGIPNLSASNYVVLGWSPVQNAISYDVYRSSTPTNPLSSGSCFSCGVVAGTTSMSITDNSPTGIGLTVGTPINLVQANFTVNNLSSATPFVNVQFNSANYRLGLFSGSFNANDCVKVAADGTLQSAGAACGSGSGGGASAAYQLTDYNVQVTAATELTVNTLATPTSPVLMDCDGNVLQNIAPSKITLTSGTASEVGYIYINCSSGSPVLTFGYSTANTYTGTNITVTPGVTGFPITNQSVHPLWVVNGALNGGSWTWSTPTQTSNKNSIYGASRQIIAGNNIQLIPGPGTLQINNTASGFNPLDFTVWWDRYYFQKLAYTSVIGSGWSYAGICGGGTSTNPTANEAAGVGFVNAQCWVLSPNTASTQASLPLFLHGLTPKAYSLTLRAGKGATAGDIYYGWSGSSSDASTANFVGIRWNNAASSWQCVIRSAGVDVASTNISGSVSDSALHTFTISNDTTANRVQCTFDGGATSTASGTIPTFTSVFIMLGTPTAGTNFILRSIGYQITGLTQ